MTIDRQTCKTIREAIDKALEGLDIPGVRVRTEGNGRYSDTAYTVKVEAVVIGDGGEAPSLEERQWRQYRGQVEAWGFQQDDLGKIFFLGNKRVRLMGMKISRHTYPLSVTDISSGRGYKCRPTDITPVGGRPDADSLAEIFPRHGFGNRSRRPSEAGPVW